MVAIRFAFLRMLARSAATFGIASKLEKSCRMAASWEARYRCATARSDAASFASAALTLLATCCGAFCATHGAAGTAARASTTIADRHEWTRRRVMKRPGTESGSARCTSRAGDREDTLRPSFLPD